MANKYTYISFLTVTLSHKIKNIVVSLVQTDIYTKLPLIPAATELNIVMYLYAQLVSCSIYPKYQWRGLCLRIIILYPSSGYHK